MRRIAVISLLATSVCLLPAFAAQENTGRLLQLLRNPDISVSALALLLGLAFWFGAVHALEPGHGKTMAAAYLVGSRGTPKHAVLLGASVTFTHTMVVFLLGIGTIFLSRYIMPDVLSKWLGVVSGVTIIWIGGMMLWKRLHALAHARAHALAHAKGVPHEHHHHDHHHHDHGHSHSHEHGPHTHTHVPEGEITMGSLIALGASGGLAPCPSALILLLSAISIGRPGLGVILLVAFSLGLAVVLTLTGLAVLYAKHLLPERKRTNNPVFRYMPVLSAAAIVLVGIVMTGVSIGWLPQIRLIG